MATIEVPTIVIRGVERKGVIMSFDEYIPFYDQMTKFTPEAIENFSDLEKIEIGPKYQKLKAEFFRATFPKTFKDVLKRDPVKHLLSLPRAAQDEAFGLFFSQTGVALGMRVSKKTSGLSKQKQD